MGKIAAAPVIRVRSNEAILTLNQVIEAQRALADACKRITGNINATVPEKRPRVCSQCGAPLHGNKCEYCNTEY